MRRALVLIATALLLTGCTNQGDTKSDGSAQAGLDQARSAIARGQQRVEKAKDKIEPEVQRFVEPYIPDQLRDKPGFDAAAVEAYLVSSQGPRLAKAGPVGSASCPADPALREGMTVRCTLDVAGSPVPFAITLTHVHSSEVSAEAAQDGVLIPTTKLLALIKASESAGGAPASVSCGPGDLLVGRVGQRVHCTAISGPQTTPFTVTIKDASGRVAIT